MTEHEHEIPKSEHEEKIEEDDYQLTLEKEKTIKEAFKVQDKDGSGNISTNELGNLMHELGLPTNQKEIYNIVREHDEDGDGEINLEEFIKIFRRKLQEKETVEELKEAFECFDVQRQEEISTAELKQVLINYGDSLGEDEVNEIIEACDKNKDGTIEWQEFQKFILGK